MGQAGAEPRGRGGPEAMTFQLVPEGPPAAHAGSPAACRSAWTCSAGTVWLLAQLPFSLQSCTRRTNGLTETGWQFLVAVIKEKSVARWTGRVSTAVYSKGIIITTSRGQEAIIADAVMTATVTVATEKMRNRPPFQGARQIKPCPPVLFQKRRKAHEPLFVRFVHMGIRSLSAHRYQGISILRADR